MKKETLEGSLKDTCNFSSQLFKSEIIFHAIQDYKLSCFLIISLKTVPNVETLGFWKKISYKTLIF